MKQKFGYALASKQLVKDRMTVRFMYRETPDNVYDSGWRFFSGFESDEYVNNPNNIGIYDISTIIEIDPDIVPFLDMPAGSVFERAENGILFSASESFLLSGVFWLFFFPLLSMAVFPVGEKDSRLPLCSKGRIGSPCCGQQYREAMLHTQEKKAGAAPCFFL